MITSPAKRKIKYSPAALPLASFLNFQKLVAIVICLLLTGCMFFTDENTTVKPKEINLVGTWKATPDSLDDMHTRGHYDYVIPKIIIRSDHTFTMKDMPDWILTDAGASHTKLISGSGRWELTPPDKSDGGWDGWVIIFSPYSNAMLLGKEPPYSFEFFDGDIDQGDFMTFEK